MGFGLGFFFIWVMCYVLFLAVREANGGKIKKTNNKANIKKLDKIQEILDQDVSKPTGTKINNIEVPESKNTPLDVDDFRRKIVIEKRSQKHKLGATRWQIKQSEDKLMDEDIPHYSKLSQESRDDEKQWF